MNAAGARHCWCGGGLQPTRFQTDTFGLLSCDGCGCYAIDPPPLASDEQSPDFYTAYYAVRELDRSEARARQAGRWSRFWRVVDQVGSLGQAGQMVVDFGSGEGRLCFELSQAGWEDVVGLDVSRARVARARRVYPGIRFFDRPLTHVDLPPAQADLCVMDNVIEHLTDPLAQLRALRTLIRPHGRIVVITPNMQSGHFRLLGRRWTPELAPHAHVFLFTKSALCDALAKAGFVVQHAGAFHDAPYPLRAWTQRLLSGDVKGAVWRAHQEMGALYGRLISSGPMLFAVAEVPYHAASVAREVAS